MEKYNNNITLSRKLTSSAAPVWNTMLYEDGRTLPSIARRIMLQITTFPNKLSLLQKKNECHNILKYCSNENDKAEKLERCFIAWIYDYTSSVVAITNSRCVCRYTFRVITQHSE